MAMKVLVMSALLAVVLPAVASADLVSGPFTTSTPIPSTFTDWTGSLAFPKFNVPGATLTGVQLKLSASLDTIIQVDNTGTEPSSGTAKTEVQVTVQDAGNNLIAPEIDLYLPAAGYSFSLGAGQSVTSGLFTRNGSSDDTYTSAAVLAEFTGAGNIILPASTYTQTWIAYSGGNTLAFQTTHAGLTGTVTYYYVPEPASLTLLAMGGLALIRRRK